MTKKSLIGLAVLAVAALATVGTPSKAEAHGYYRRYAPAVYPAYRPAYRPYYPRTVVYSTPVYYSAPVVYAPAPVVYSQPVYYRQPYYYGPGVSFGYYGNGHHGYGGVSVRLGF